MFTIALQRRRVSSREPEDDIFVMRVFADLYFFVVALQRLRRLALLACSVASSDGPLRAAVAAFDVAVPMLKRMRDVGEHIDDYAIGKGRDRNVSRFMLQVAKWDGHTYRWLDATLDVDASHAAAKKLFAAVSTMMHTSEPDGQ